MAEAKKASKAKRAKGAATSRKTAATKRKATKAVAKAGAARTRAAASSRKATATKRKATATKRKAPKAGAKAAAGRSGSKGAKAAKATRARSVELPGELLKSVEDGQRAAIDAVRAFVDTVDRSLPRRGEGAARRQEVIDSALDLADRLVQNQFDFLRKVIKSAGKTLSDTTGRGNGRRGR